MKLLGDFFGIVLSFCYGIVKNYGLSIIVFTFFSKIILLPISIMVQKNSIKMVQMYPELNRIKVRCFGNKDMISEEEYQLYKKESYHPMLDLIPVILQLVVLMGVVEGIRRLNIDAKIFCGIDLGMVPGQAFGITILIPLLAAASAWLMCFTQNKSNVLQSEQGKVNQITTLLISVGLSLYLGFFVEGGIGWYWTVSNLLSIAQMYLLNFFISPAKFVDYEDLAASRKELQEMEATMADNSKGTSKEYVALEKKDYKRFLAYGSKQIVFYSEKNGFYKYFQGVIEYILNKTDIVIHYITNDPEDKVFELQSDNFQVYYIGMNKLIVLMMKLDTDIMVMTTPDLQKYQLKRSLVRSDIEYVYIDHAMGSNNLTLRKHALDNFDTIFIPNDITETEIRKQEAFYQLKPKQLVHYGYGLIDEMIKGYTGQEKQSHEKKQILIAPSWQKDNLIDLCGERILDAILGKGYHVILRPHPQYVRHFEEKLLAMKHKYEEFPDFELQMDFSSNKTVFNADILMTDWSGIAYEYSFTTLKPTLFIDTPMKVMNPDYKEIDLEPFDITIRNEIGISVKVEDVERLDQVIQQLLNHNEFSTESLANVREKYIYNVTQSAKVGGNYLIKRLIEYSKK